MQPLVTAITSISLDHQAVLGDTLAAIAQEKAGIIKPRIPVVTGILPQEAREVVSKKASIMGAEVWRPGPQMTKESRKGIWNFRTPEGSVRNVGLRLKGTHQAENALVALGILHWLVRAGFAITEQQITDGLSQAFIPGRIEELRPGLVVDGAHNEASVNALVRWLKENPKPQSRILVWGMGAGRDPVALLRPLLDHVDEIVTTRCAHPKAADPMDLAVVIREHCDVELSATESIDVALEEVYREADQTIVAGSLYLAGAARSLVRSGCLDGIQPGQGPLEE